MTVSDQRSKPSSLPVIGRPGYRSPIHTRMSARKRMQVEDPSHLLGELGVAAGLPGLRGLPAHAGGAQDLPKRLDADDDPVPFTQVFEQLRPAPRGERQPSSL